MTTHQQKLYVDDEPNLVFMGELVAEDEGHYYKKTERWTEISLYKTTRGRFVCYRVKRSNWQGEDSAHEAQTVDDHAAVVRFFGYGDQAKDLYRLAEIEHSVDPDTEETDGQSG